MTRETYVKMVSMFEKNRFVNRLINILNKGLTGLVFILYPLLIVYLFVSKSDRLLMDILVPLDSFIVVTVFRFLVNRPRPYEKFETQPIIKKETKGLSFPSRHVFSAFIITMTFLCSSPFWQLGIFLAFVSVFIAVVRVISGVHYISDVLFGALIAILVGIIFYIFI